MSTSKILDGFIAYQFVKILSTPWVETDAYALGIIDDKGTVLKKSRTLRTTKEKAAYTMIHRLIWNIKRLLDKLPPTKTRLGSFASALWMLREHAEKLHGVDVGEILIETFRELHLDNSLVEEELNILRDEDILYSGIYQALNDIDGPGNPTRIGDALVAEYDIVSTEQFAGYYIFSILNNRTSEKVYVTKNDIEKIG